MKSSLFTVFALLFGFTFISCDPKEEEPVATGGTPEDYYKRMNLEFVSRIVYLKDDQNNYTETKLLNLTERGGTLNYIVNTVYATEAICAGKISGKLVDAFVQDANAITRTNEFGSKTYGINPYNSYVEWDYDQNSTVHIINYVRSNPFFTNYFGGHVSDVYNATKGARITSWTNFPSVSPGYIRYVGDRLYFVDMYHSKIRMENPTTGSWSDLSFGSPVYSNTFDFETAGTGRGIVAMTNDIALKVFNINTGSLSAITEVATASNKQFAGWDGYFSVAVYKNGSSLQQPYVVIRRNSTFDIYRYDLQASTLQAVHTGLPAPSSLVFDTRDRFGSCDRAFQFYFSGDQVFLWTTDAIYELKNKTFEPFNFTYPDNRDIKITTLESAPNGFYFGLQVLLTNGKRVSDVVLMKNK